MTLDMHLYESQEDVLGESLRRDYSLGGLVSAFAGQERPGITVLNMKRYAIVPCLRLRATRAQGFVSHQGP
jgi:hypothetical protein